jgi:biopolymer transport protein ExbB
MRRGRTLLLTAAVLLVVVALIQTTAMAQGGGGAELPGAQQGAELRNANFFEIVVVKAGPIGWILILGSVCMLALAIEHFVSIRRSTLIPEDSVLQVQAMFDERRYREALDFTSSDPSFISYILHEGLTEAANGYNSMQRSMQEAADERTAQLYRKIELLNILGAIAPMLGLFGTIVGMLQTFFDIAKYSFETGSMPPPHVLSSGIFVALLTTAWGLFVAIPALSVYGIMRNKIDQFAAHAQLQANELLKNFKPGARPSAKPQAKPSAGPPAQPRPV